MTRIPSDAAPDRVPVHGLDSCARLGDHIRDLEQALLRPEVRQSRDALEALLADDFVEFASDCRRYTKAEVIAALHRESPCVRTLTDFRFTVLAENVVLATSRA